MYDVSNLFLFISDYAHRKRMHPQELSKKLQEKEINDTKQRLEVLKNKSVTKDRNLSTMTNL